MNNSRETGRVVLYASELLLESDGVDPSWIGRMVFYASEFLLESDQVITVNRTLSREVVIYKASFVEQYPDIPVF